MQPKGLPLDQVAVSQTLPLRPPVPSNPSKNSAACTGATATAAAASAARITEVAFIRLSPLVVGRTRYLLNFTLPTRRSCVPAEAAPLTMSIA